MQTNFELKPAKYSLAGEFGLPVPLEIMIDGFEDGHPAMPEISAGYVFMPEKMRDLLAFWQSGERALKIIGDPATGKTSLVEQFHARLRWPLYKVSCKPTTEARELIGQFFPTADGSLKWVDGPVLRAAREGTSVLLDEYNIMEPGEATGLNMLLEGYSFTVESTSEIVKPAKGFKVFVTENHVESRLAVSGRNVQDAANDDRFMVTTADYLPAHLEQMVVLNALLAEGVDQSTGELIADQVVIVANKVRAAYRADDSMVDKPMSTRTVVRWAKLIRRFAKVKDQDGPMVYALRRAFQMNSQLDGIVTSFTRASLGTGTGNAP
jgi:cobaltochelatase CobS